MVIFVICSYFGRLKSLNLVVFKKIYDIYDFEFESVIKASYCFIDNPAKKVEACCLE